jgi:hypothetical protein
MAKQKLPPAKNWFERDLKDWNVLSFTEYLKDIHQKTYKLPYVSRNWNMERGMIKQMIEEHGNEIVKDFIDEAFKTHKTSTQYPTLNFWFIYSYKRNELLPKLLNKQKQVVQSQQRKENQEKNKLSVDEMIDLL